MESKGDSKDLTEEKSNLESKSSTTSPIAEEKSYKYPSESNSMLPIMIEDIIERLKKEIAGKIGTGADHLKKLNDIFADMDRSGDGKLAKKEFEQALISLSIDVTPKEIDVIYQHVDKDNNNMLDYSEFITLLGYLRPTDKTNDTVVDQGLLSKSEKNNLHSLFDAEIKKSSSHDQSISFINDLVKVRKVRDEFIQMCLSIYKTIPAIRNKVVKLLEGVDVQSHG